MYFFSPFPRHSTQYPVLRTKPQFIGANWKNGKSKAEKRLLFRLNRYSVFDPLLFKERCAALKLLIHKSNYRAKCEFFLRTIIFNLYSGMLYIFMRWQVLFFQKHIPK